MCLGSAKSRSGRSRSRPWLAYGPVLRTIGYINQHRENQRNKIMSNTVKQCPVCELKNQQILNVRDYGDKSTYDCSHCGRFTISGTAEAIVEGKYLSFIPENRVSSIRLENT